MSQHTATEVHAFAFFQCKLGQRDTLIAALQHLVPLTNQEQGCLHYQLLIDHNNADSFIMLEKFINKAAFDAHCSQPYIKHFMENQMPTLCESFSFHLANEVLTEPTLV